MAHRCPVCGYPKLAEAPRNRSGGASYEICASCGFQFGVSDDDAGFTYQTWRAYWREGGMRWASTAQAKPAGWDPTAQLKNLRRKPATKRRVTRRQPAKRRRRA